MADKFKQNNDGKSGSSADPKATHLIRQKIASIYNDEPDAKTEAAEAEAANSPSKHQLFMRELIDSGKDIATIQTEWHKYYISLPDPEKLKVWDEFYSSNKNIKKTAVITQERPKDMVELKNQVITSSHYKPRARPERPKSTRVEKHIETVKSRLNADGKLKAKHHIQSLLFGLGMGLLVVFIFLFGFFNEVVISPFIQPSRNVTVPVIIGNNSVAPTPNPEVIIPKINVEIPVDYNVNTTDENVIENDLQDGVIHYPTTVEPGQLGNTAFFGHSSNNIFNPGKYKFAFVLLHTLVNGDTFYLTYNHTVYVYKVISHTIVSPNDVAVLGPVSGQQATATLITCDPPGTSINRLIVVGQQVSPAISSDTQPTTSKTPIAAAKVLPSNGPTLWGRFIDTTAGKAIVVAVAVIALIVIFRRTSEKTPF